MLLANTPVNGFKPKTGMRKRLAYYFAIDPLLKVFLYVHLGSLLFT